MRNLMNIVFSIIMIAALTACDNDDVSDNSYVFTESQSDVSQRKALENLWDKILSQQNHPYPFSDDKQLYSVEPSGTKIGVHSQAFKDHALNWFNWYRVMGKLNKVTISAEAQRRAEYCATGLSKLNQIKHGLPESDKNLINAAYGAGAGDLVSEGSKNSNLYSIARKVAFYQTLEFNFLEGKIKDSGPKPRFRLSGMGHRFWGLNPNLQTTGIAISYLGNTKACYKVFGKGVEERNAKLDFAAFPNGYFPVQAEMRKAYDRNNNFPNRNAIPESEYYVSGSYTVWTIQSLKKDYFNDGKNITVTIRQNNNQGELVDRITTNFNGITIKDNGALFVVKKNGSMQDYVMVIKPKHGVLSRAYKAVKGNNAVQIFHITIDGEGIDRTISYRIMYIDLKYFAPDTTTIL